MDWVAILRGFLTIVCLVISTECARLNDYILDYQPLTYDRTTVHRNHERVRRSAGSQLKIRFEAFGRDFQLELSPAQGIFSPDHMVFTQDRGLHYLDTSYIYHGQVKGERKSAVHISIHNGSMEGHVEVPETRYHIEPAAKYLHSPAFHTIIYPETHLNKDPYRARREAERGSCAVDHLHDWMEALSRADPTHNVRKRSAQVEKESRAHNIYSEASNTEKRSSRAKRTIGLKNTCPLHLQADPLLFDYFQTKRHGTRIEPKQVEEEIVAFMSNHVNAITNIYQNTIFQRYDGSERNTGVRFNIRKTTIWQDCTSIRKEYCENSVDVSNYLDMTSRTNHNNYCLTFTFTYRDFQGGTLGLAWVATETNEYSGVCAENVGFNGVMKSLNTGIVTIINFGKTVPNRVSQLTFAHEVGHNFGSPHDIGSAECAPFGTSQPNAGDGNYIMFPSATSGDKPNNDNFSPCSRDNITRIIQQILDPGSKRRMCFTESGASFCGNRITEGKEECDCGFLDECAGNRCCVGRDPNNDDTGCKLPPAVQCSAESGVCCDTNCEFILPAADKECAAATECAERSICDGAQFRCPTPQQKANGTFCNDYSKVCSNGECIAPICSKIAGGQWEECFLVSGEKGVLEENLCYVACKNPTTGECVSSSNTDALAKAANADFKAVLEDAAQQKKGSAPDMSDLPIQLPPGSACDNGYCDVKQLCERFDAEGPFNQLTNMIFDPVTLNKVKDWIVEHWWAVLLMAVGLVVFMGVFVKVFGYNTPSEDPKRKKQRQERERARARQAAQPKSGRPLPQPQASAPYHTEMDMDMAQYGRGGYPQGRNQYDRVTPGYAGHAYEHGYGKNHI